uniref:Uncharacterized protein n=1 Tax=viral metagenome TaxID=1070528 RepID=A0A6H1ZBI7_9ZZZZ
MPFKNLSDAANKLWESVYNSSKDKGDSEEIAAKKAWAAVSRAYKKVGDKWVKKSDVVLEFSMAITNAPYDKATGELRWKAVASDTNTDLYGERMDLGLYESFISNIQEEYPPPEAFKSLVTSDYWLGGMPYVSISHYPDLNGEAVPGIPKTLYVDGERFKAKGIFFDNPLGRACHRALNKDIQEKAPQDKRIRISIAFLDLAHRHGDGAIFERKSLDDFCPECVAGVGGKVYLKGYLVHLALTRSPVNPRTEMEVEKAMTTRKEDAATIIGEEEAEELEKKAALVGKSEALVIKADDETEVEPVEEPTEHEVPNVEVPKVEVQQVEVPKSEAVEEKMDAPMDMPYGGAISMTDAMAAQEAQKEMWRISDLWATFRDVVWNILDRADVEDKKGSLSSAVDEFKNALTAKSMLIEQPDSLFTKMRALYDNVVAARSLTTSEQEKRQAVQPALDEVGAAIVAELTTSQAEAPKEEGLDINQVKSLISESLAPISDQLAVIAASLARQSEPRQVIPVPRSMSPQAMRSLTQAQEKKLSPIDKLARRSVGLTD